MRLNINDKVRVRLTDVGRKCHQDNHEKLFSFAKNRLGATDFPKYRAPKEDSEGWSTWQLWDLMREFGPHIRHGGEVPFETEIDILDPEKEFSA